MSDPPGKWSSPIVTVASLPLSRSAVYALICGLGAAALAIAAPGATWLDQKVLGSTIVIGALTGAMSVRIVRQERGYIKLSSIGTMAAAMALPAPLALAVGATSGLASIATKPYGFRFLRLALPMFWTTAGCVVNTLVRGETHAEYFGQLAAVATITCLNWAMTSVAVYSSQGFSVRSAWRDNVTMFWLTEFAYFGLAAGLIANLLDGTNRGLILAGLVIILATSLGESASEYRKRTLLESHFTDATRHLAYRRAAEGIVHNLRNHVAIAKGYIAEVAVARVGAANRHALMVAKDACDDALAALDRLGSEAAPRIHPTGIDANQIISKCGELVSRRASSRRIVVNVEVSADPIWVLADQELIREVLVNLLLNSVDAAPVGGSIGIAAHGRRDWVEFRVVDNGPGIPDGLRDRLFEPHFTTKSGGHGMGLFTCYGIVREHRGQLLYEGSAAGSIFLVRLPGATPATGLSEAGVSAEQGTVVGQPSLASTKR